MDKFTELNRKVDKIESMIFGHEGPGLKDTVVRLDETVKHLDCTVQDLKTGVSGLVKYVEETKGKDKAKEGMVSTIRWLVGSVITITVAALTIIVTIILSNG